MAPLTRHDRRRARALERQHVPLTRPIDVIDAILSARPLPPSPPGGYRWTPRPPRTSPEAWWDAWARAILRAMVRFSRDVDVRPIPPSCSPPDAAEIARTFATAMARGMALFNERMRGARG